jgi:hypothetical protein
MSNSKISALTSASTVAGTEVLPIVQSSTTVKVAIQDLNPGLSTILATKGGTGLTSYAVGDLIYASTTTTLAKLADVATGNALISGGVGVAPSWGKIGLTTHISGTLPTANGGTNLTTFNANGVMYASSSSVLATSTTLTYDGTTFMNAISASAGLTAFIARNTSAASTTGKYVQYLLQGYDTISSLKDLVALRATPNDVNNVTTWGDIYTRQGDTLTLSCRFGPGFSVGTTTNPGTGNAIVNGSIGVGNTAPASGAGITFPATQSASSDANTLDDYEEGTWTPVISQNGTGTLPFTATTATGKYTKIGNTVIAYCYYTYSDRGAGNNGFYSLLTGYPYSTANTKGTAYVGIWQGAADTNQYAISMGQDASGLIKTNYNGGPGAMIKSDFPASGSVTFTVCYST